MSSPSDYTVGWICALPIEAVAATVFLDERVEGPATQDKDDTNNYKFGRIGNHHVVIATLPKGEYGTATAASVAKDLTRSFPNVRIGLMVGIGGGAPNSQHDIRLGDVVVSSPQKGQTGVFQYDFGESIQNEEFKHTRALDQPPQLLRAAVGSLEVDHEINGNGLGAAITRVLQQKPNLEGKYGRPLDNTDILFQPTVTHIGGDSCDLCNTDEADVVYRQPRQTQTPAIHHGTIASANKLMKDAILRDRLALQKKVLCFEMEAAGLMNGFSCLVIRGICDYSDSHKNKAWQGYAAMAAAAYAKQIINIIRPQAIEEVPRLVETQIRKIARTAQDVRSQQEKDEVLRILTWLANTDFGQQQTNNLSKWQKGTVQWLLESREYQKWVQEKGQILFCPGIPGAGKTVSVSVVINDLTQRFSTDTNVGVAFIYCSYTQTTKRRTTDLFASILKQLCQVRNIIPDDLKRLYDEHETLGTGPQYEDILKVLVSYLGDYSRVMIVVDALDEWEPPGDDRRNLVDELLLLHREHRVNLLVTSRFIPAIEAKFKGFPFLHITASQDDIDRYIEDYRWPSINPVCKSPDLQRQVKTCISEAAKGMFLLAQIYVNSLDDTTTPSEVMEALQLFETRSNLKDQDKDFNLLAKAYDGVMLRINQQSDKYRHKAHQVMSWVCFSKRELYVRELRDAIAVRKDEVDVRKDDLSDIDLLLSVCCGLVVLGEATQTVQLVHYTAQDYFRDRQQDWFPDAHSYLAKQCINFLSLQKFECGLPVRTLGPMEDWDYFNPQISEDYMWGSRRRTPGWYALYEYASVHWGHHVRHATTFASDVDKAALSFLCSERKLNAAMNIQLTTIGPNRIPQGGEIKDFLVNGLHLAAFCGLDRIIPSLRTMFEVDSKDSSGRTPLSWASQGGWDTTVSLLLSWHADFDAADEDGCTSLIQACRNNHAMVVKHLLNVGANVNAAESTGETGLHFAAKANYHNVAELLLSNGAMLNLSNKKGKVPLNIAVQSGSQSVYETLCKMGADPRACGENRRTALMEAAWVNNEALIQRLLEQKVDLEAQDRRDRTALMEACEKGHQNSAVLLLQHNAKLDVQDWTGRTALMKACQEGHEHTARLLIDEGANLEIIDHYGRTALMHASRSENQNTVRLLLQNRADKEAVDNHGCTVLAHAIKKGREENVRVLLEYGADQEVFDRHGRNALIRASQEGHGDTVKVLLQNGATHGAIDNEGFTALVHASKKGSKSTVQLLLAHSTGRETSDLRIPTALEEACAGGHLDVVSELINSPLVQREYSLTTSNYGAALTRACSGGHEEIIQLLLGIGALDSGQRHDGSLFVALLDRRLFAEQEESLRHIVDMLLESGADLDGCDQETSQKLIFKASKTGNEKLVRMLTEKRVDVNVEGEDHNTPIMIASRRGHVSIVEVLRAAGATFASHLKRP
ncbi:hypothetical protein BFJ68_g17156 [Fusarium oxysporum]|uniref:Uncharacterized protein n=1 Tax=Fusarium oxysporum TaxID=5507 RepID=A0A420P1G0_FUSOX|nr:hypothetical protein BFJ68_g17156 [Fusarium oxysporum]